MNWGVTGLLIVFGAFIVLLVFSPSMSCFGRRLKSPFYPLMRRRKNPPASAGPVRKIKTDDYGFKLNEDGSAPPAKTKTDAAKKAEDYGFKLD
jgi:glucan phosphoethanolaminetransferase (alkaline phosphatase superfamily)